MFLRGFVMLGLVVVPTVFAGGRVGAAPSGGASPEIPFAFVANLGQAPKDVRFVGNGPGFRAQFREGGVTVHQAGASARITFANGAAHPLIEALEPTGATANYLRGGDSDKWLSGLPFYRMVRYRGVWPGIEIRFKGEAAKAKAEYVVEPGASVDTIRLRFDGHAEVAVDGRLIVRSAAGEFREDPPYLYQERDGSRVTVGGAFRIHHDGTVGFTVAEWDHSLPLV
ncbi:MAG TPA: hypothetical protein VNH18_36445, partial [Bryobacteraceae bacterium]|nr:hypothetical protein [Bryobacteraceae bacterium]